MPKSQLGWLYLTHLDMLQSADFKTSN